MTENWGALAKAVAARRDELRVSQAAVQQAGGPSDVVLSRIERNEAPHPRRNTLPKIDAGMGWPKGTAAAILRGESGKQRWTPTTGLNSYSDDELLREIAARLSRARLTANNTESGNDPEVPARVGTLLDAWGSARQDSGMRNA